MDLGNIMQDRFVTTENSEYNFNIRNKTLKTDLFDSRMIIAKLILDSLENITEVFVKGKINSINV
jgi:hypothetical protein